MELTAELKTNLIAKAKEELEDIVSYNRIYETALANGNRKLARMINRIAEAEYEHAEYLCSYLKDHGAFSEEDHKHIADLWKTVDRIFDDE